MGKKIRSFIDGEVVFREGEAGDYAFVVKRGKVALSKNSSRGPVEIEVLDSGEVFGEMGVLNGGQRTLTAAAVGDLSVELVDRKDISSRQQNTPGTALSTVAKTGVPANTPANSDDPSAPVSQGWISRLLGKRGRDSAQVEVRIVPLIGENGDQHARNIHEVLSNQEGINAKVVSREGVFNHKAMPKNNIPTCIRDGQDMLRKFGGDILLWGNVSMDQKVLHLHFTSSVPADEDLPGGFTGFDVLPVPVDITEEWGAVLYATVLSATVPFSANKAKVLTTNMEAALEEGGPTAQRPPREFTTMDKACLTTCLAHTLAIAGQRLVENELLQLSAETYQRAIDSMPSEDHGLHLGLAQKNLGCVLALEAERAGDVLKLATAADAMRTAIDQIPARTLPREWAAAQNKLGHILYRQHMTDSAAGTGLLSEAITAFRSAVQIYTRTDAPERWADVMNNYAQATQVLGGQLHDPEILQKAVRACRSALEIRHRNRTPFMWAATQNTLGSALFLMGKITNRIDHLETALDAFQSAQEVYTTNGAAKMASVIARNMQHVRSLQEEYHSAGVYRSDRIGEGIESEELDENWWRDNVVDDTSRHALG